MTTIHPLRLSLLLTLLLGLIICLVHLAARDQTRSVSLDLLTGDNSPAQQYRPERDPVVGNEAPAIAAHDFKANAVTNQSLRGRIARLLLVADCTPCIKKTLLAWNAQAREWKSGDTYVLSLGGKPDAIRRFLAENRLRLNVLFDDNGQTAKSFNAAWMPRAYVLDAQGILRYVQHSSEDDHAALTQINKLMP